MKIYSLEEWCSLNPRPEVREWTPEEEAEALRLVRESLTDEELKEFATLKEGEIESGVDLGEFLTELEERAKK